MKFIWFSGRKIMWTRAWTPKATVFNQLVMASMHYSTCILENQPQSNAFKVHFVGLRISLKKS